MRCLFRSLFIAGMTALLLAACGSYSTYITLAPESSASATAASLQAARDILQRRYDMLLAGGTRVEVNGSQLRIGLRNEGDVQAAVELAGEPGQVILFQSATSLAPGSPIPPNPQIVLTNSDVTTAESVKDPNSEQWFVSVEFTAEGSRKFAQFTQAHVGEYLVVARDDIVLSAPRVSAPIAEGQSVVIAGSFDEMSAGLLAAQLSTPPLPFRLLPVDE